MPRQLRSRRLRRSNFPGRPDGVQNPLMARSAAMDARKSRPGSVRGGPYDDVPLPMYDGSWIRLLAIDTHRSSEDHLISCNLRTIRLDSAAKENPYVALSYMWGAESTTKTILLNGRLIRVRQNLWDFLIQRRREQWFDYRSGESIWIDALCINQESTQERNHQVAIMGQIYATASRVQIWLGPDKKLMRWCSDSNKIYDKEEMTLFINHKYWSRAWILQECVLATTLLLQCGSMFLREVELCGLFEELNATVLSGERSKFNPSVGRGCEDPLIARTSPFYYVWKARTNWHNGNDRKYVSPLCDIFTKPACSDPRDRIYSKLAIMGNSVDLVPDYSKTSFQLFMELSDKYIEWDASRSKRLTQLGYTLDLLFSGVFLVTCADQEASRIDTSAVTGKRKREEPIPVPESWHPEIKERIIKAIEFERAEEIKGASLRTGKRGMTTAAP